MRICTKCGQDRPDSDYVGKHRQCRTCRTAFKRQWTADRRHRDDEYRASRNRQKFTARLERNRQIREVSPKSVNRQQYDSGEIAALLRPDLSNVAVARLIGRTPSGVIHKRLKLASQLSLRATIREHANKRPGPAVVDAVPTPAP